MQQTLVSVVIPTHNRRELLTRAIESVQNQSYSNLEIIVVSDGSTDGTKELVEEKRYADKRIFYYELMPAQGGNVARNTGIEASHGEYIAFLDDDDEWLPKKIEKQMEVISKQNVGLVYSGVHIVYVDEKVEYNTKARDSGDLSKRILIDNCIGTTSSVLVNKQILKSVNGFDNKLRALQDYDLWIRCCQLCNVGIVPDEMLNYYNYNFTKQISSNTEKYEEALEQIRSKYTSLISKMNQNDILEMNQNDKYLLINKCLRNGDSKKARMYIRKAIKEKKSKKNILMLFASFLPYSTILKVRSHT